MSDSANTSHWKSPLQVWLTSEYLDNSNFRRFGAAPAMFEKPSWPLGLRIGGSDIHTQVASEIIDTGFDHDVSCAWQLPLRYSRLKLGIRDFARKGDLNWSIRCVGRWAGDQDRFVDLTCTFNDDDPSAWKKRAAINTTYALTPFSIITQRWIEGEDDSSHAELLYCDIAFFYTFETFIQECLSLDAHRSGIDSSKIVASYEHIYRNSRPRPEFVCIDPSHLRLSRLCETKIDWQDILDLKYDGPLRHVQDARLQLFKVRRQCHLMVAIAASCIGTPGLASAKAPSGAVQISRTPFAKNDLAAHWLKHVVGALDYPSECERLLVRLAEQYGNQVSVNSRGITEPSLFVARNLVEESVCFAIPSLVLSREEPEAYGRYRWALFDTSLDNQSVTDWRKIILGMQ
jgi:hypothetical protein